ncbi:metalloregulator ArsR/SmtB family transcription factor [Spirillospora sp. NPDC047418]
MKLLADPLRARIVSLLADEALCTCHLVEETGARQTNVSNHLRVLRDAGLVETEPCGRFTYYRLRPEALEALATRFSELAAAAHTAYDNDRKRPCT